MNLEVLRRLKVMIELRLLLNQDSALIRAKKNIRKKIARCKAGIQEDLQEFIGEIQSVLSVKDSVKLEDGTVFEDVDMSEFTESSNKEDINE